MREARAGEIDVGLRHAPISESRRRERQGKQQSRHDEKFGAVAHSERLWARTAVENGDAARADHALGRAYLYSILLSAALGAAFPGRAADRSRAVPDLLSAL